MYDHIDALTELMLAYDANCGNREFAQQVLGKLDVEEQKLLRMEILKGFPSNIERCSTLLSDLFGDE
jgi:hypothetical protein